VKRALISDIHGNLEGLEAVLADIRDRNIAEIVCLGDIIGYGPNPRKCIDVIMQTTKVCILGDHDQVALSNFQGFNIGGERADGDPMLDAKRRHFLGERPRLHRHGGLLFVHGSPRDPLNEYVFPEDVHHPEKMETLFSHVEQYCFQGHTHLPGVFTPNGRFLRPDEMTTSFAWAKRRRWSTSARSANLATATRGRATSNSTTN
jgi:predicted phosphodiesterase